MTSSRHLPEASTLTLPKLSFTLSLYPCLLHALTMRETEQTKKTGGIFELLLILDRTRYTELPQIVRERGSGYGGRAWLEKREVQNAMEWKLKHGKYRPQLPKLVASNDEEMVKETTRSAFALYDKDPTDPFPALKRLAELKGIGPATASLLLSLYDEENVPFFSDELFRWACWNEREAWARRINYDMKEYRMLWDGVKAIRDSLDLKDVKAVELEKVAFVCGKLATDEKLAVKVLKEADEEKQRMFQEAQLAPTTKKPWQINYKNLIPEKAKGAGELMIGEGASTKYEAFFSIPEYKRIEALKSKEWPEVEIPTRRKRRRDYDKEAMLFHTCKLRALAEPRLVERRMAGHHEDISMIEKVLDAMEKGSNGGGENLQKISVKPKRNQRNRSPKQKKRQRSAAEEAGPEIRALRRSKRLAK